MAFPVIQDADTVRGQQGTNATPWSIPYPAHLAAGDLIVCVLSENNSRTLTSLPAGWVTGTNSTTGRRLVVGKKVSNGTESGSSFSVAWSGNSHGSWHVFRITGWEGTLGTTFDNASTSGAVCFVSATALSSTTPDPPVLDPNNWAAEDALWIACACSGGATAYPASYTNGISDVSTGGGAVDSARRSLNTSSENPGTFTAPVGASVTGTIAIRPGAAAPVYTDTPSGGIILGGSVAQDKVYDDVESGGTVLGGSAVQDITRAFTPSGGLVLGGSIAQDITRSVTPSGGIVLNGSCVSSTLKGYSDSPSGGIVLGGSVTQSVSKDSTVSGGLVLGGSVSSARTIAYTQSGGLVLGGSVVYGLTRAATPSGGLVLGGSAVSDLTVPEVPSAGIVLGGSVVISQTFGLLPSAGLVLGGSMVSARTLALTQTGGLVLGGSCAITVARAYTVSGGLVLGGSAVSDRTFAKTPSGGLVLGGSVVSDISRALAEAGGLVLGGSCVVTRTYAPAPSGGIVLGGSVSVAYTMNCGLVTSTTDTQVVLLLHADGADGSTVFTDSSPSNHTMTRSGVKVDVAQSQFGGASALFQGISGQVINTVDSTDWTFGSGDFTIDFWVRFNSVAGSQVFISQWDSSGSTGAYYFYYDPSAHQIGLTYRDSASTAFTRVQSWTAAANTWYHIALVRSGANLKFFVGGTQLGSDVAFGGTGSLRDSAKDLLVGEVDLSGLPVNGWMDEVRISKGIARWTANFTPPTVAYDPTTTVGSTLSGGIILGGTATSTFGAAKQISGVRANVWTTGKTGATSQTSGYAPSGGIVLGGSASTARTLGLTPSGGLVLGGSVSYGKTYDSTLSGGIVLNGSCISSTAGQKQIAGVRANVSVAGIAGGTSLRIGGTRALVSVQGKPGVATSATAVTVIGVRGRVSVAGKPGAVAVQQPVSKTIVGTRALVNVRCSTDWGCGVRILLPIDSEDLILDLEDSIGMSGNLVSSESRELALVGSGGGSLDPVSSGGDSLDPDRSSCS